MWRRLKYAGLVGFAALLLLLFYLSVHGIPQDMTDDLLRRLPLPGLTVRVERVKLGVCEGLIATRVRCYRLKDPGEPLIEAERVILRFSPMRWLKRENGIRGARLQHGIVRLEADTSSEGAAPPRRIVVEGIGANVRFEAGDAVSVADLALEWRGMQITGRGRILLPERAPPAAPAPAVTGAAEAAPPPAARARLAPWFDTVERWNDGIAWGSALHADLDFHLDTREPARSHCRVRLDARDMRLAQTHVGAWSAHLALEDRTVRGDVTVKACAWEGIWIEDATGQFTCDTDGLRVARLTGRVGRGAAQGPVDGTGTYAWASGRFAGHATTGFDPRVCLPPVKAHGWPQKEALEAFRFPRRPPVTRVSFEGRAGPEWRLALRGEAEAQGGTCRGITNTLMRTAFVADLSASNGWMRFAPALVAREEGEAHGVCALDFTSQTLDFEGVSTLDPRAVAAMIGPFLTPVVGWFRMEGPVAAAAWGRAGYAHSASNDLEVVLEGRHVGWHRFLAESCALNVWVLDDTVGLDDVRGILDGGTVAGMATFHAVGAPHPRYDVFATAREVDFHRLMRRLTGTDAEPYHGRVTGAVQWEGLMGEGQGHTATGRGWVKITDGRIFQIPLFGGLSEHMARVIPGLGAFLRQTDARATVVIGEGRIHSDEILVEGDVLSLSGKGDYYFDGRLDFQVQVKLLRKHTLAGEVLRVVTLPVSKILEFRLRGTLQQPRWEPVYLPKEMFLIFD